LNQRDNLFDLNLGHVRRGAEHLPGDVRGHGGGAGPVALRPRRPQPLRALRRPVDQPRAVRGHRREGGLQAELEAQRAARRRGARAAHRERYFCLTDQVALHGPDHVAPHGHDHLCLLRRSPHPLRSSRTTTPTPASPSPPAPRPSRSTWGKRRRTPRRPSSVRTTRP
jgi:hypothetical protein